MKDRAISAAIVSLFLTVGALVISWLVPSSKYVQDVGIMTVIPETADYYGAPFVFRELGNLHRKINGQVDIAMLGANALVYFIFFFALASITIFIASKRK